MQTASYRSDKVNIMKTKILLAATVALSFLSGCTNASSKQDLTDAAPGFPVIVATSTAPVTATLTTTTTPTEALAPVGKPVNTEIAPPKDIKLSPATAEIAKLAHAGVDSSVMLSYATNSVHTFGLGADEIVYLNDIGMNSEVINAMIRHDQIIREASLAGATVTSPTTPAPGGSVWAEGQVGAAPNTWQQPVAGAAPVAQEETVTTAVPPPAEERPQQVTVDYFYDSLAPYGTWVDIGGYGRCWRPTIAASTRGWRPYSHGGRWVWTDSGWYWYSDYSWGWAPFHYGRWFSHSRWGWCWMPDTTWGPSWVSWRYSDSHCGWAPLPPAACYTPSIGFTYYGNHCNSSFSFGLTWDAFTFVSYHNWNTRRYDRDCVPRHQVNQVFNNTTVINNIVQGNNNVIVNQGISPTRITAVTGTPIRQVPIRDTHTPRGPRRHEELATDGSALSVVRASVPGPTRTVTQPTTPPPSPTAPPVPTQTVAAPQSPGGPRGTGDHPNTPRGPRVAPIRNQTATTPAPAPTPVQATVPTTTVQTPTTPSSSVVRSGPRTDKTPRGSLTILPPRAEPAPVVQVPQSPVATPGQPPRVASTPNTPRTDRSPATPWLNNTRAQTTPGTAQSQQPYEATYGQTPQQTPVPTRQAPIRNTWQQSGGQRAPSPTKYQEQTPSQPASQSAYVAPQTQAPVRSAPIQPTTRYEQPVRSMPSQHSAPAYTPPTRSAPIHVQQAPAYSSPPRSAPSAPAYTPPSQPSAPSQSAPSRSETRSSQSGSGSGRSSDDSKESRSPRGR